MVVEMSTVMSSLTCSDLSPCLNQRHRRLCKSYSLFFSSRRVLKIKHQSPILGNQESYQFNIPFEFNARYKAIKAKGESDDLQPEDPVPPEKRSSPEWKKWMVVITLSIILPSYRHKWGPLVFLRSKVDETIETVETVTDITEDLGEDVEKVAEALENKIPDQEAKLKEAVETIDRLAKDVVKETEEAKRLIQKVPPIRSLSLSLFFVVSFPPLQNFLQLPLLCH
ncbi:hypothetical protein VitviT2T_010712 [Vitis vinifera]|uniref:Uncharacterized protein n=1 Tax=Vitis vinifera TaxID=29760 RepID=A0ABY9C8L3_VITVI|nr:uncharacterized protein LOC100251922 isoform X1 [Vitis vinifera]XP_059594523.1 uncharacterized protein LOC100251922 isoform X1 [Vitis vinifera]WJZ91662.1 hypothetical protein VitviT2T_010712 [Vitis vinifera]